VEFPGRYREFYQMSTTENYLYSLPDREFHQMSTTENYLYNLPDREFYFSVVDIWWNSLAGKLYR
jgi:hypothetical protein